MDSWAVGVLAYEILFGRAPFSGETREQKRFQIVVSEPHFPDQCPGTCVENCLPPSPGSGSDGAKSSSGSVSALARDFIQSALRKDPAERPSIETLINHPWILQFH